MRDPSVILSKNGSQVNVKLSQKNGLLSCIRQESGAKSHAQVINCQNWTWLSHDFCTAFMTDTWQNTIFLTGHDVHLNFRFYWGSLVSLTSTWLKFGAKKLPRTPMTDGSLTWLLHDLASQILVTKPGFPSKYSQVWLGCDSSTTITQIPFLLRVLIEKHDLLLTFS